MEANLPLRLARSAVFTVVCTALASAAHWFAGGSVPDPQALSAGGLLVMAAAVALAGRERSPAAVIGLLVAAQAALHVLFDPASLTDLLALVPGPAGPPRHGLTVGVGMVVAHLTAALLTGWWLACGEAALWSLLRRLGAYAVRRVGALLALLGPLRQGDLGWAPAGSSRRAFGDARPLRDRVLRHAVRRRGPPVLQVR